jgi:hypothetical protein
MPANSKPREDRSLRLHVRVRCTGESNSKGCAFLLGGRDFDRTFMASYDFSHDEQFRSPAARPKFLAYVAMGKTNPEIVTILGIRRLTVKKHLDISFKRSASKPAQPQPPQHWNSHRLCSTDEAGILTTAISDGTHQDLASIRSALASADT